MVLISDSFSCLAAPPVQTAGRGRAHLRKGAHSTCKLIFEMCAGFLILKLLNPHMFYIYDYHYHRWDMRFYMHASISVGYICDKWNVEYDSHA